MTTGAEEMNQVASIKAFLLVSRAQQSLLWQLH